jgi:hypothetical protein
MQKQFSGATRSEAIRRIFTEGVAEYQKESGLPMGEALAGLIKENPGLWQEYCADTVAVQGDVLEQGASLALASEMSAYAEEHRCSPAVALSEVAKRKPNLWQRYQEEIATTI